MEKDTEKTIVIFRKFKEGDVIAIFPEIPADSKWENCMSYQHIGQHGSASIFLIDTTKPATEEEYFSLKKELESIGYNLNIKKRISSRMLANRYFLQ